MNKNRQTRIKTETRTSSKIPNIETVFGLAVTALLLTIVTVLNIGGMHLSSPFPSTISPQAALAQLSGQGNQTNSSLSSSSTTSNDGLRFTYSKLGISSPIYQRISYDSERNSLTITNISTAINKNTASGTFSSSQAQSQSQSSKKISNFDKDKLKQMIEQNGFFQADSIYPPPSPHPDVNKDQQNYDTLYVLSVDTDNKHHTVLWTDTSENIPTGIIPLIKTIEEMASK